MSIRTSNGDFDEVRLYDLARVASGDMPLSQLGECDEEDLDFICSIMDDFAELRDRKGALRHRPMALPVLAQRVPVAMDA
ncbi:MAG TPA: hypothetical protein VLA21_12075 [Candidatus Limnocylindria bacterium]|nr:hypothetical protein [Candidatus Limnocylindria bacterium]